MHLNADFTLRATAHAARMPWMPSPVAGVERKMLDRIGDELARATSIVRYAAASRFSPHVHGGGEEFLVLEGVFQDEDGDYPAGCYVRNPPQSRHAPRSAPGCVIFVKLWQFDPADRTPLRLETNTLAARRARPGVEAQALYRDAREDVRIETWAAGVRIDFAPAGGIELFVLDGGFEEGGEAFARWSWLRLPAGAPLEARAGSEGARVWVKEGHLSRPVAGPAR
ncbi:MAG TPA: cupin domain-containing protein [Burkholderiales bacterium]|nr:cupin domain-containing protein [Burkholderiales bacterium]